MNYTDKIALERLMVYAVRNDARKIMDFAVKVKVQAYPGGERLCYWNGERGHMLNGKVTSHDEDGNSMDFEWARMSGAEVLHIMPLTMAEYARHLKPRLDPHGRYINDMEDLATFLLRRAPKE